MGILIAHTKGNYTNPEAVENVIRYITRTRDNETKAENLIGYGACGIIEYGDVQAMIDQMIDIQKAYGIDYRKGRRIYHETFTFSPEECQMINFNAINWFARECCREYYKLGFQVVYGIHSKNGIPHIHFAVNTISFLNGRKFHSYKMDAKEREKLFNEIMKRYFKVNPVCYPEMIIPLSNPAYYQEIKTPLINPIQYG